MEHNVKQLMLSTLWAVTVAVNSGSTSVNVSVPESSFATLLSTIQSLVSTTPNLWSPDFLTQLFQYI
jgi:hypothetical protein